MEKEIKNDDRTNRERDRKLLTARAIAIISLLASFAAIAFASRGALPWERAPMYRAVSSAGELDALVSSLRASGDSPLLVDLRDGKDYETAHAPGFLNVPNARDGEPFATWIAPYRRDKPVVLMCYGGNRSARAFERLVMAGFTRVIDFTPGYEAYVKQRGEGYSPEAGSCDCPK